MANSAWPNKNIGEYPYGPSIAELTRIKQEVMSAQNNISIGTLSNSVNMASNPMHSALQGTRKGVSELRVSTIQNGYLVQFGSSMGDDRLDTAIFAATPAELAEKITVYLTSEALKAI